MPAVGDDLVSFGEVGCGSDPLRCWPTDLVIRVEMAIFLAARSRTSVLSLVWLRGWYLVF